MSQEHRVLVLEVLPELTLWRIIGTGIFEARQALGKSTFVCRQTKDINALAELLTDDGFYPDTVTAYRAISSGGMT